MRIVPSESSAVARTGDRAGAPAPSPTSASPSAAFESALRGFGSELDRGETTMRSAMSAMRADGNMSATQLLALQSGVYRYSDAVDLASRLIDRTSSGVKTILQGTGQ